MIKCLTISSTTWPIFCPTWISILTLISDEEYNRGLEQMKAEIERDPEATYVQEFAELECLAVKA
ncbi:hypothetical protein GCM10010965_08570 [Caldalkalibacillus thermarum]|nr:hypothetical protein GCM10010965_08570 [Caldalkalibacillus thermarum]